MLYISNYTGSEIDSTLFHTQPQILSQAESIYKSVVLPLALQYDYTISEIDSPEFKKVLLDQNNKVLAGIRLDGSVFVIELK